MQKGEKKRKKIERDGEIFIPMRRNMNFGFRDSSLFRQLFNKRQIGKNIKGLSFALCQLAQLFRLSNDIKARRC